MKPGRLTATLLVCCAALLGFGPGAASAGGGPSSAPVGSQDFQDVPPDSAFYLFIHNLYVDGVVNGYACQPGGPADPCVPPSNLPYYHPGSNVTRGQNAKFTDNGRRVLTGPHTGSNPDYGLFSAINTSDGSSMNAGLYGKGGTGVLGQTNAVGGAGGVFSATVAVGSVGVAARGQTGALLNAQTSTVMVSGDGLDVGGAGGFSDAVYAPQPSGDANYSFYGNAHIHGSNIASGDYESEVVYQGAAPLVLGSVVALDPANVRGGPLGVVPADVTNADAAVGVISYRLTTATVNGVVKTVIDAHATAVQPGDRAYVTILGRVAMVLPVGAQVGTRLAVGANRAVVVAGPGATSFGRVASRPDATGLGDVLVNFK